MTTPPGYMSSNPVQLTIVRQDHYSRGLAVLGCLFLYGRLIALLPILLVLYVLGLISFVLAWIMQFVVLFTGSYPEGAHQFLTGFLRWSARSQAWLFGLSDKYPTTMQP